MAFTTVVTHATGDVFPAADWNTYVRDNMAALHGDAGTIVMGSGAFTFPGQVSTSSSYLAAPAVNGNVYRAHLPGDTQERFSVDAAGLVQWGPGGATVPDTNLYRGNVSQLKTDDLFYAVAGFVAQATGANNAFRNFLLAADAQPSFAILGSGALEWGPGGASVLDTSLSRVQTAGLLAVGALASNAGNVFCGFNAVGLAGTGTFTPGAAFLVNRLNVTGVGTITVAAPVNPPSATQSGLLFLIIHNASAGSITLAWNAVYSPSPSTVGPAAGSGFIYMFFWNAGTSKWEEFQGASTE